MRKNILNNLLILCCLLTIVSCKAKKQAMADRKAADTSTAISATATKLAAIKSSQVNFTTFSAKAHAKMTINNSSNDVTLNMRIQKGKKIWVSITAIAGIEVARALITPDSLLVINKLQGLYLKKPFSYVYKYASSQVDYNSLEAIFVGNAIPQLLNAKANMQADSGKVILSGNLEQLVFKMVVGADMKTETTTMADYTAAQSMDVNNSAFIQAANRVVPSQIDMTSTSGTKKVQMNLHYIKVDFDLPLEYPFSIPSRYDEAK